MRQLTGAARGQGMRYTLVATVLVSITALGAQRLPQAMIEWPYYGGDQAQSKYSPAADITPQKVNQPRGAGGRGPGGVAVHEDGTRPGEFQGKPRKAGHPVAVR